MKLYTKEMFLTAAEKCEVSMIDAKHIMQYIDEYVTSIELPTDEEIYNKAKCIEKNIKILPFDIASFQYGAKWMRDKINKV